MKVLVIVGLVLAATLQANAIAHQELPKIFKETIQQSFACVMKLGPEAANVPLVQDLDLAQLPEENPVLNTLWGCIWDKKGIIDKQGEGYSENLRSYLSDMLPLISDLGIDVEGIAGEVAESCKDVESNDYKIKSIKMQNCVNENLAKVGRD
ncbi:hypothetical protein ILUMI_16716 [Ignelater luminosus]|uniref:Uncharacterized protein n=1 Tax=Ignelater luminosus TaxID=2038154 RepID=A0A8K0CQG9_IGNLU|nr:hypothetical protein ILUMI_16716 [Ignelater luminosus]